MSRLQHTWIALALALMSAPFALAEDNPDAAFYKAAAEGGLAEVELGKLAQEKASSASVKDFGAMMVKDHSAANEKLSTVASKKGIALPTSPSLGQTASKAKLELLGSGSFDRSYIEAMVKDHQDDIKEFQTEAASGRDPDAKAYAAATLPTLQTHLQRIQVIAHELRVVNPSSTGIAAAFKRPAAPRARI